VSVVRENISNRPYSAEWYTHFITSVHFHETLCIRDNYTDIMIQTAHTICTHQRSKISASRLTGKKNACVLRNSTSVAV
jgi:hypothetical protein